MITGQLIPETLIPGTLISVGVVRIFELPTVGASDIADPGEICIGFRQLWFSKRGTRVVYAEFPNFERITEL